MSVIINAWPPNLSTTASCKGAAMLLRIAADWDWFVTLSSSDYPLVTQDDHRRNILAIPSVTGYSGKKQGDFDSIPKLVVDNNSQVHVIYDISHP
ncbi:Os11g0646154 [Oryza sativa Japonica Group]|uniref:Os11g0646154 protein n=1 Tax=Oryza sativa subsp. japonica TaxID=39947 RepID=A0A0P0Y549_ORYSJ|nr:Os11g0646154 [Oryza sativa Japonica Group]